MGKRSNYLLADLGGIAPTPCPCGTAKRAFLDDPEGRASFHVVQIRADSRVHYHKERTEIYYVLRGEGLLEVDGEPLAIRPGSAAMIKPGCRHRALPVAGGELTIINVVIPVFSSSDEWFD